MPSPPKPVCRPSGCPRRCRSPAAPPSRGVWSGSRLTRRCGPARRPRPRSRRFISCPGPRSSLWSRQRRHGLEDLPRNGSPQGFWPLLAGGASPPEIHAEGAPRTPSSDLRAPQPPRPPHPPIPHPLAAQDRFLGRLWVDCWADAGSTFFRFFSIFCLHARCVVICVLITRVPLFSCESDF